MLINEAFDIASCSNMFFFIPVTTDRKELINLYKKNVILRPAVISDLLFNQLNRNADFDPRDLEG